MCRYYDTCNAHSMLEESLCQKYLSSHHTADLPHFHFVVGGMKNMRGRDKIWLIRLMHGLI